MTCQGHCRLYHSLILNLFHYNQETWLAHHSLVLGFTFTDCTLLSQAGYYLVGPLNRVKLEGCMQGQKGEGLCF